MILEGWLIYFSFGFLYFIPVCLCIKEKQFNAITTRDLKSHLVLALLNFMSIVAVINQMYLEQSDFNCGFRKLILSIESYPYTVCYIMMSLSLVLKYKTNHKIDGSFTQLIVKVNRASNLLSYKGYNRYFIVAVMGVAFSIGYLDYFLNYGFSLNCNPTMTSSVLASSLLFVLMTIYLFRSLRNIRDKYLVRFQLLGCGTVYFLFLVSIVITASVSSNLKAIQYVSNYLELAVYIINHLISFCCPLLVIWRSKRSKVDNLIEVSSTVTTIWANTKEKALFKVLCAKYFVIENFMFLEWFDQPQSTTAYYARGIQLFINYGSPYELNIDEQLRNKAMNAIPLKDIQTAFELIKSAVVQMLTENMIPKYQLVKHNSKLDA